MIPSKCLAAALLCTITVIPTAAQQTHPLPDGVERALTLPPSDTNPRNSEGDFITLKDRRILYVYTHFTAGAGDHAAAFLASRESYDGGRTWSKKDKTVIPNEGAMNVMSVSLLRLHNGAIALLYLRKNSTDDCRPVLRLSTDEAGTWSDAIECIHDPIGYYVVNNDRLIQLKSGRLLIPSARHAFKGQPFSGHGEVLCWLSDDNGQTWRASKTTLRVGNDIKTGLQEPGVVELSDTRLMMFCRTSAGCQYLSWSTNGGDTWSPPQPSSIVAPVSPASIERIPKTGDLLLIWNNHDNIAPELKGKRTPLTAAISSDEGKTWHHIKNIETNPNGWYCYTAVHFFDDHILLGLCAGDRRENNGLALSEVLRFPIAWLYK